MSMKNVMTLLLVASLTCALLSVAKALEASLGPGPRAHPCEVWGKLVSCSPERWPPEFL